MSLVINHHFSQQLPEWRPNDDNFVYPVIDVGSNGIRFSITDLAPPKARLLRPLYSERADISILDALKPSGDGALEIPPDTIVNVSTAIARFHRIARLFGAPSNHIIVLATEGVRRASNASKLLEAITAVDHDMFIRVIDPAVETLFGAVMGSRSGFVNIPRGGLFLDLGGGSVQMTWVDTKAPDYGISAATAGVSLPYGAARLIKILEDESHEVRTAALDDLRSGFSRIYAELCLKFPALEAIRAANNDGHDSTVDVYLTGGGFRGYGSMLMFYDDSIEPYPISSVNTYSAPGSLFARAAEMERVNKKHDGHIFGLSKRRRSQFPAIVAVVEALVAAVPNIGRATFCGGSNRQGVLMMMLPPEMRESDPLRVLSDVSPSEEAFFDAAVRLLTAALPSDLVGSDMPTVLNLGLGPLLIRESWLRAGYSADTNSVFALHDSVVRDSDCPGLTHLARAVLGLSVCARWGGGFGPAEEPLFRGLCAVADSHAEDASFWALYVGAVAAIIASVFPVMPKEQDLLTSAIRLESKIVTGGHKGKKDKVTLTIGLDSAYAKDTEAVVDKFESTMSKKGNKSAPKVVAQVVPFS
ncbi:Retrograde regulation protein 2 [Ophiocordyceps camponoti-floridani]|uniref:Retrograde regulation protein 2 n=1 Tax=Ophiocordyceps camponoti-floridani TaxID=2030778 RepID=A0A8H4VAM7_9HYPO|nr:Retrograde regulation protein 2 [Ophiocordyceps camponoti-floridani]